MKDWTVSLIKLLYVTISPYFRASQPAMSMIKNKH